MRRWTGKKVTKKLEIPEFCFESGEVFVVFLYEKVGHFLEEFCTSKCRNPCHLRLVLIGFLEKYLESKNRFDDMFHDDTSIFYDVKNMFIEIVILSIRHSKNPLSSLTKVKCMKLVRKPMWSPPASECFWVGVF